MPSREDAPRSGVIAVIFQLAVVAGTLGWLAVSLPAYRDELLDPAVLFFVLAITVVDLIPVPVWGGIELSLSFPILIAVAVVYPAPVAAVIAVAGAIDPRELKREVAVLRAAFNRAQVGLSTLLGSYVFHALATTDSVWYRLIAATLAAALIAYVVNVVIVAVYESLRRGVPVTTVVAKMHGSAPYEFVISYIGLGLFGVAIARFFLVEGIWSVVVFLAPLVFARQMYFRSRALADQLADQNELLADQAGRLERLLKKEYETVDELKQLNQMKGEFVAVVSHELRTPVTALIGYSKTLQQQEFAEDAGLRQEFLRRMERQGDRLLRLVENLLTASRVESRELPVTVSRVLFEEVCREIIEGLGREAERVHVDVPDDLPVLHTDRQLVGRVVSNLIDNALKYSPDGAGCELGARGEEDHIVFWVRDQGIGMSKEQLERIFDRFYQVDSSSTRTFAGAGLGLALVADLLDHLGGTIDVESAPERGSTFTVRMPVEFPTPAADEGDEPPMRSVG